MKKVFTAITLFSLMSLGSAQADHTLHVDSKISKQNNPVVDRQDWFDLQSSFGHVRFGRSVG